MVKVVDSTEKDKRVFKKPQENREEESVFYNDKYFADIGFPGTKVFEGEMTEDGVMKGGYYKHTEQLTYPFRRFVQIIQREGALEEETSDEDEPYLTPVGSVEYVKSTAVEDGSKRETPGFFSRLGEYGKNVNEYVKNTAEKIGPYFQTKDNEIVETSKGETSHEKESESEPVQESVNSASANISTSSKKYWVVKIPILKDEEFTPKGKYEKAEEKMNQILREEKVDKKIGKSKIGEIYEVGSKYVRICEEVKEWGRYEIDDVKLPGSKMEKIRKVKKGG